MKRSRIIVSLLAAGVMASPLAYATNGYLPTGYGMKNEAMGGVGIALPQDSIAAAVNPAGMVMVGDRFDIGLTWFRPNREETTSGSAGLPFNGTADGNGRSNFFIPDMGYNKMINPDTSLGVTVFANGGMNTQYNTNVFGGSGPVGVNLEQLFVSPSWSMKINSTNSVGVALNLVYQMFSATGLQAFTNPAYTSDSAHVTNNGTDTSTGVGLRLGWTGEITPMVTLGATYQPKTTMSKFSKYAGLFADQGDLDIPANFGAGIAVKADSQTTVGFDVERIQYAGVNSVGDSPNSVLTGNKFGSSDGPGFGWQNMTVYKLGVKYMLDPKLTLRAGLNHNTQQIQDATSYINILVPGVVQNHLSLGATWTLANKSEVTVAYVHAFSQTVTGAVPAGFAGNTTTTTSIKMHEDSIGVMYGW